MERSLPDPSWKVHLRKPDSPRPLCGKRDGRRFTEDRRAASCAICLRMAQHAAWVEDGTRA